MSIRRAGRRTTPNGFSLIEVLVSLAVVSIALLGVASLQLRALQLGQSSQFRTQAVVLAADLAERMEANKEASANSLVDGAAYVVAPTSTVPTTTPTCTMDCTAREVAALDLYQWQTQIASLLPQSSWEVRQTVSGNPGTYEITVNWVDARGDQALGTHATSLRSSYVSTKTVYRP